MRDGNIQKSSHGNRGLALLPLADIDKSIMDEQKYMGTSEQEQSSRRITM